MDFSIIEGLTEEELTELYEDVQFSDTRLTGWSCWSRDGTAKCAATDPYYGTLEGCFTFCSTFCTGHPLCFSWGWGGANKLNH